MEICLHFLGNLSSFFSNKLCLNISSCPTIREVVEELIRKYEAPLTPEHLIYVSDDGTTLSGEENICRFNRVYIARALQGG